MSPTYLLSNGAYSVLLGGAGSGFSRWRTVALTGWSGDRTEDGEGIFLYLRDLADGRFWSVGAQPPGEPGAGMRVVGEPGRVASMRALHGIEARLEVCVAPGVDLEVRRLRLRNRIGVQRRIEVTSYAEIVLQQPAAHAAHPAFQKLFVETAFDAGRESLLARRRPRASGERHPWLLHALFGEGALELETDRARFLGRGRTLAAPRALVEPGPLAGTTGSVLDPVFCLRRSVELAPRGSAVLHAIWGVAPEREAALALVPSHGEIGSLDDAFVGSAELERRRRNALGLSAAQSTALQEIAGGILYGEPSLGAPEEILRRARVDPELRGRLGLVGDAALAIFELHKLAELADLRALATARLYWAALGLAVDLLALCDDETLARAARETLAGAARDGLANSSAGSSAIPPKQIVLERTRLAPGELDSLLAAARLVAPGVFPIHRTPAPAVAEASHAAAVARPASVEVESSEKRRSPDEQHHDAAAQAEPLVLWNGIGGFDPATSEYVLRLEGGRRPPMPWSNVLANPGFGVLVSEAGAANTWSRNSGRNRLTPWSNDPIADPHGEALYLRDDESGAFWSPQPGPAGGDAPCEVRHGFGRSTWRRHSHELDQEIVLFVPPDDPLRVLRLRLVNRSDRRRRLSVFSFQRLVLGVRPAESARFVATRYDPGLGALLARNSLNDEFADGVAFAAAAATGATEVARHASADRASFIGEGGSMARPAAIARGGALDGRTGAGLDPCFALQLVLDVAPRATVDCVFLLGEAAGEDAVRALVERHQSPESADVVLLRTTSFWRDLLGAVEVETPSPAIDFLLNGWLLYQTVSCRLWGRTAFYQSGGAYGFRDQLQDSAALLHARPALLRSQILLHAAHQFREGDVLHWWHPPSDRGIRTRFADDLCWLPFLTALYVRTTGDASVLDERVGFVESRALAPGEDEAFLQPTRSAEEADLYEHCGRALDRALTRGAHGLPLMGTGDWNDGMNRVGREGRGESVWMAFFLHRILEDFAALAERRGDRARLESHRAYREGLERALEENAWDGDWYRRAYYDDGTPLGSHLNSECRIDVLAQAWAALSHAVPRARAEQAVEAALRELLDRDAGLIRLLTPPFDKTSHDPGYIKGYVPGIRENGGQYTHAALWLVEACATLGQRERAAALFEMLSPIHHSSRTEDVATYQVEPYVVAADVYGVAPHRGRGGWTWYTASAAWMFRIGLESILGLRVEGGDVLWIAPCIPDAWPGFRAKLRPGGGPTRYDVRVVREASSNARVKSATLDGAEVAIEDGRARIPLSRDGASHAVHVTLGT